MNCADLEIQLCDYVDGTLAPEARAEVETHLGRCAGCAQMARDAAAAVEFMHRVERVEPPPELLTRILFDLPSAHHARARQSGRLGKLLRQWLQPVLQPRFAMGFAMTILSFSLLGRVIGIAPQQFTFDELRPAKVWETLDDKLYRTWQRTVKFYENLRLVYEIQHQLREWTQQDQEARAARAGIAERPATAEGQPAREAGGEIGGEEPRE